MALRNVGRPFRLRSELRRTTAALTEVVRAGALAGAEAPAYTYVGLHLDQPRPEFPGQPEAYERNEPDDQSEQGNDRPENNVVGLGGRTAAPRELHMGAVRRSCRTSRDTGAGC